MHKDVCQVSTALGYEIIGYLDMALGELDEAKLHLSTAQDICEKKIDLLLDEENHDMRDLLAVNIQRIKKVLEIIEIRRGEDCADFVKPFDATIIDRICDDLTKYSSLSSAITTNTLPFKKIPGTANNRRHTAGYDGQDSMKEHKSLPCHDPYSFYENCGDDASNNTTNAVDDSHSTARTDAPTCLWQDESPHAPVSSPDESQMVKKQIRIEAVIESDTTVPQSSLRSANISKDANCIIHEGHLGRGLRWNHELNSEGRSDFHSNVSRNDSPPSSQPTNVTEQAPSSTFMGEDEVIFIPDAIVVEQDDDIPQASVVMSENNSFTLSRNRKLIRAIALIVIVSMCLALLIGFLVTDASKKSDAYKPIGQNETLITEIENSIESHVLQRNATFHFMSRTDPRFLALDWILNNDEMELKVSDSNLYQRYILALLAFRFSSLEWTNWLTGTDECEWYGVTCDDDGTVIGLEVGEIYSLSTPILTASKSV